MLLGFHLSYYFFTDINDIFPNRFYPCDVDMRLLMSLFCVLGWFLHGLPGCSLWYCLLILLLKFCWLQWPLKWHHLHICSYYQHICCVLYPCFWGFFSTILVTLALLFVGISFHIPISMRIICTEFQAKMDKKLDW